MHPNTNVVETNTNSVDLEDSNELDFDAMEAFMKGIRNESINEPGIRKNHNSAIKPEDDNYNISHVEVQYGNDINDRFQDYDYDELDAADLQQIDNAVHEHQVQNQRRMSVVDGGHIFVSQVSDKMPTLGD